MMKMATTTFAVQRMLAIGCYCLICRLMNILAKKNVYNAELSRAAPAQNETAGVNSVGLK